MTEENFEKGSPEEAAHDYLDQLGWVVDEKCVELAGGIIQYLDERGFIKE